MTSYRFIQSQEGLAEYLESIRSAKRIDFDTEFISEGKYKTELCLIQVTTEFGPILLDAPAIGDLSSFWERLCSPGTRVTAHSARSEMEFCYKAIARVPEKLFDIQLAAGFVGIDYPASLKKLVDELLHIDLPKDETRTDWRLRPLSILQIDYALNDVLFLDQMTEELCTRMKKLGRLTWFEEESQSYLAQMVTSFTGERWQQISGLSGLGRRELAIVRELWVWREEKAAHSRKGPNHILRDDVIIELARLKTTDPERIAALRSIHRRTDSAMYIRELPNIVARGLSIPESALPVIAAKYSYPSYTIASNWLLTLLHSEAVKKGISPKILAVPQDAREMVAYCAGTLPESIVPRLSTGWRREFLGKLPEDLLSGKCLVGFDITHLDDPLKIL